VAILVVLAIYLVQVFKKRYPDKAKQLYIKLKRSVFWNPIIRVYLISCLDLDLYSVEGIKQLYLYYSHSNDSPERKLEEAETATATKQTFPTLRLAALAVTLALIVAVYRSLRANSHWVLEANSARLGTLYSGLKTWSKSALDYTTVFFVRRLLFAAVITLMIKPISV